MKWIWIQTENVHHSVSVRGIFDTILRYFVCNRMKFYFEYLDVFPGRDSKPDRWNQDGGGGGGGGSGGGNNSNFNNFRNNNRNNNMNRNNNNSNNNMNSMGSNNFGNSFGNNNSNNMGNMANIGNMQNSMNSSVDGPLQTFAIKSEVKSVLHGGVLQGYASAREIRAKYPNANDCEIVVLEKQLV